MTWRCGIMRNRMARASTMRRLTYWRPVSDGEIRKWNSMIWTLSPGAGRKIRLFMRRSRRKIRLTPQCGGELPCESLWTPIVTLICAAGNRVCWKQYDPPRRLVFQGWFWEKSERAFFSGPRDRRTSGCCCALPIPHALKFCILMTRPRITTPRFLRNCGAAAHPFPPMIYGLPRLCYSMRWRCAPGTGILAFCPSWFYADLLILRFQVRFQSVHWRPGKPVRP